MQGPLVLFALRAPSVAQAAITRQQALAARKISDGEWAIETERGAVKLMPFTELGDAPYATYLTLS